MTLASTFSVRAKRVVVVAAAIAVAAVLAGATLAGQPDPKKLALQLSDMPTGFSLKSSHYEPITAAAKESNDSVANFKHYGYITGYEADYSRDVSLSSLVTGAIEIQSFVSVYKTSAGPKWGLAITTKACPKHGTIEAVGANLGDQAVLCAVKETSGGTHIQAYLVSWRTGRFRGNIAIAGVAGGVAATQAVSLARKQDARFRAAR